MRIQDFDIALGPIERLGKAPTRVDTGDSFEAIDGWFAISSILEGVNER